MESTPGKSPVPPEPERPAGGDFSPSPGSALPRCAYCGETMRYNVPRLGPDGGYVHAETGSLLCKAQIENPAVERRACPDCYGGHFRPCQTCGDSGHVLFVPNGADQPRLTPEKESR